MYIYLYLSLYIYIYIYISTYAYKFDQSVGQQVPKCTTVSIPFVPWCFPWRSTTSTFPKPKQSNCKTPSGAPKAVHLQSQGY